MSNKALTISFLGLFLLQAGAWAWNRYLITHKFNEPYSVNAFNPSQGMIDACRADPNCMDVIDLGAK